MADGHSEADCCEAVDGRLTGSWMGMLEMPFCPLLNANMRTTCAAERSSVTGACGVTRSWSRRLESIACMRPIGSKLVWAHASHGDATFSCRP